MSRSKSTRNDTNAVPKSAAPQATYRPKLHVSLNGNTKIGTEIASFSTLPGDADHLVTLKNGTVINQIPGTCSSNCKYCFQNCYAVNALKRYATSCLRAWSENTLLLRSGRLFEELDKFLNRKNVLYLKTKDQEMARIKVFRINVSGEITSGEELAGWNDLAKKHPETTFAVYTKNYAALEEFLAAHENTADNFVINVSQWHGSADGFLAAHPGKFNVFEYIDINREDCVASEGLKEHMRELSSNKSRMCPAVTETGKHAKRADGTPITCDSCGKCYRKTGKTTGVWAH